MDEKSAITIEYSFNTVVNTLEMIMIFFALSV